MRQDVGWIATPGDLRDSDKKVINVGFKYLPSEQQVCVCEIVWVIVTV